MGENKVGIILKGSGGKRDAMKALEMAGPGISERVLRPLLVDWNNGRAGESLAFFIYLFIFIYILAWVDGRTDERALMMIYGSAGSGREGRAEFGGYASEIVFSEIFISKK